MKETTTGTSVVHIMRYIVGLRPSQVRISCSCRKGRGRIAFAVLFLLFINLSCATKKSRFSSETSRDIQSVTHVEGTLSQEKFLRYFRTQFSHTLDHTKITVYDTSMEIDASTGRPPVLAEIENVARTEVETTTQAQQSDSICLSVTKDSSYIDKEQTGIEVEKTRTSHKRIYLFFLCMIGAILCFFLRR